MAMSAHEDRDAICARSELRLIIITNDEEVVLGRGQDPDQPQLCGVDVLELVDATGG
jgi:hypothetical protein